MKLDSSPSNVFAVTHGSIGSDQHPVFSSCAASAGLPDDEIVSVLTSMPFSIINSEEDRSISVQFQEQITQDLQWKCVFQDKGKAIICDTSKFIQRHRKRGLLIDTDSLEDSGYARKKLHYAGFSTRWIDKKGGESDTQDHKKRLTATMLTEMNFTKSLSLVYNW